MNWMRAADWLLPAQPSRELRGLAGGWLKQGAGTFTGRAGGTEKGETTRRRGNGKQGAGRIYEEATGRRRSTVEVLLRCDVLHGCQLLIDGSASTNPTACHALCSLVPPPAQDSQALWDSLRAELQQDLKDQMLTLGKSLMEEMRGQIANLSLGPVDSTVQRQNPQAGPAFQPRQPPPGTARTQFQWDPQGRPICLECGQAGHTPGSVPNDALDLRIFSLLGCCRASGRGGDPDHAPNKA
ncbi:hypothetical protein F7725_002586 [Dissostichus mawsoni]|uniref:Uncharacterized protein n=1 Tax=Dissostichus mawsoni TaxID=36200 RepID=A0A7J5Y510_DISMA|nr:hypothetical protein F7725_002586 [Dissostichus mawsoni]